MKLVFERPAQEYGYYDKMFVDNPYKSRTYELGRGLVSLLSEPPKGVELAGKAEAEKLAEGLVVHAIGYFRGIGRFGGELSNFYDGTREHNALLLAAKLNRQIAQGNMDDDAPFTFVADDPEAARVLRDLVPTLAGQEGDALDGVDYRNTLDPLLLNYVDKKASDIPYILPLSEENSLNADIGGITGKENVNHFIDPDRYRFGKDKF